MRIAINALGLSPDFFGGGIDVYTYGIIKSLLTTDKQRQYILLLNNSNAHLFHDQNSFNVIPLIMNDHEKLDSYSHRLNKLHPHIIHHPKQIISPKLSTSAPTLLSAFDIQHEYYPEFFSKKDLGFRKTHYKKSMIEATHIITTSNFTIRTFEEKYHITPEKCTAIHAGIDLHFWEKQSQSKFINTINKYNLPTQYLIYPAMSWAHKNHDRLLQALKVIRETDNTVIPLVLTGTKERPDAVDIKSLINHYGLQDQVFDIGFVSFEELRDLYSNAFALVLPSLFEGGGSFSIFEAMACGLPVIGADATSIPEVVGKSAILFNPMKVESIAEAIINLYRNKELQNKLIMSGYQQTTHHDIKRYARKLISVYDEIAQPETFSKKPGTHSSTTHMINKSSTISNETDIPPILIYQMGKVGSSAILSSLKQCGLKNHIDHIHFLSEKNIKQVEESILRSPNPDIPRHLRRSKYLRQQIDQNTGPSKWKIITLVRDPIARHISATFQNTHLIPGFSLEDEQATYNLLINKLIDAIKNFDEKTNLSASWFDNEVKHVFGFDVYTKDFPTSQGYQTYETQNADILLIRLEDLNQCHKQAFREFLGIEDFKLKEANIGSEKKYNTLYERVKKNIVIPATVLDKIYQTKSCTHFYTASEIEKFKSKWTRSENNNFHLRKTAITLPKISVVTPSFNQAEYLEECIDSILSQDYPNLEYIIMDGGSTDGSAEIIKKYEKHLTFWQTKPDNGQYNAVNEGFKKTTGNIMTWLNSDDIFHKNAFKIAASIFDWRQDIEWIMGRPNTINNDVLSIRSDLPLWSLEKYLQKEYKSPFIQQEGTFWKRRLWEKAGATLQTNLELAGDLELWARFFRYSELFSVDILLAAYRYHQGQRAQQYMAQYINEAEIILDREIKLFEESSGQKLLPAPKPVSFETVNSLTQRRFNISNDTHASRLNKQGEKLFAQGNITEAFNTFDKVIKIDPQYALAYNNIGVMYWQQNRTQETLECLQKAFDLNPKDSDIIYNFGEVLYKQKKYDRARNIYATYLLEHPGDLRIETAFNVLCKEHTPESQNTYHTTTSGQYEESGKTCA